MLKFLKKIPFFLLCLTTLKAQKDTFFLSNGEIYIGKIHLDERRKLDVDGQYGAIEIKKKKLYKIVSSDGVVTKYHDLTYLEKGLSKDNYLKVLKPLSAKFGLFGQRLYYGNIHISRRNFFDALSMIQDAEIDKALRRCKRKNISSQILVPAGWFLMNGGALGIVLFEPHVYLSSGGLYYSTGTYSPLFYGCTAVIAGGFAVAATGYVQGIIARKIKKRRLIDRYNSLLLQS